MTVAEGDVRVEQSSWWPDVWFVWCGSRTVGTIRSIPGGYIRTMRKWQQARDFDEAVELVLNPPRSD